MRGVFGLGGLLPRTLRGVVAHGTDEQVDAAGVAIGNGTQDLIDGQGRVTNVDEADRFGHGHLAIVERGERYVVGAHKIIISETDASPSGTAVGCGSGGAAVLAIAPH